MNIRFAKPGDFEAVAKLHCQSITTGFLSKLGVPFLTKLYDSISRQNESCVIVAHQDEIITGFVAGTVNVNGLYKRVLIKNWFRLSRLLIGYILNFKTVYFIFETFLYGFKKKGKKNQSIVSAELLAISVDNTMRGKGIGKKLVSELETFFKVNNVTEYKVVTFSEDRNANRFYNSCGFTLDHQFIHHGNTMNEYKKIKYE